jgi:hypothetical protein
MTNDALDVLMTTALQTYVRAFCQQPTLALLQVNITDEFAQANLHLAPADYAEIESGPLARHFTTCFQQLVTALAPDRAFMGLYFAQG